MQRALDQFHANLVRVRSLGGIHASLAASTTPALDLSDLLRAQIVLAVSAFDTLVHEVARLGMLESASGARPVTDALRRFQISFEAAQSAPSSPALAWLDDEIRRRHSYLSFQMPDKVADAIRHVSDVQLWNEVGRRLRRPSEDVKLELRLLVERRNKIAHEADADPSFPGTRWPIDPAMTKRAIDFLESVGSAILATL